ncbi:MAG: PAS domain-containing protein [Phyllobacterium sp.]
MRHNGITELFGYWHRLRDNRPAPERTEIDPAAIGSLLADTFILQATGAGDAMFRLAGTRICARYGRELRGIRFASLWQENDRGLIARLVQSVVDTNGVVATTFEGRSSQGRKQAFEMLLLPLSGEGDDRRMLGAITAIGAQYWLGAHPVMQNVLKSVRTIDPDNEQPFQKSASLSVPAIRRGDGSADPQSPGETQKPAGYRKIGHLFVYEGGKVVSRH